MKYYVEEDQNGQRWYKNPEFTKLHRIGGPAAIRAIGDQLWYHDNVLHREDGPAVILADGGQVWYKNGKRHRHDGPAVTLASGTPRWFLNGMEYSEAKFKRNTAPVKELTVAEIETLLGYKVKVVNKV